MSMPYEERSTPTAADVEKGKNSANNESGNEEESESTGGIGQLVQEGRRLKTKSREEKEVIISPNNMGQTIHTPPTSPIKAPTEPKKQFLNTPTPWKVYSQNRGCNKHVKQSSGPSGTQIYGPIQQSRPTQQQLNTDMHTQHQSMGSKEECLQKQQLNGPNEITETMETGEIKEIGANRDLEAAATWELARKLGVCSVDDQERMVEKFLEMEDRDRKEAEKVGNVNHIP